MGAAGQSPWLQTALWFKLHYSKFICMNWSGLRKPQLGCLQVLVSLESEQQEQYLHSPEGEEILIANKRMMFSSKKIEHRHKMILGTTSTSLPVQQISRHTKLRDTNP